MNWTFKAMNYITDQIDMKDKVCIVTGANSGLGKGSALLLAKMNATVIMLCRNRERGQAALLEIKKRSSNPDIDLILADLSSQPAIREFVQTFQQRYGQLNVLLNCAGVQSMKRQVTADGLEIMFATNYLGHFLLTNLLFDLLQAGAPSRVVTVSGAGHKAGVEGGKGATIEFNDLQGEKQFSFVKSSKQAVLAKILFTFELARRWAGTGITANTVGPGLTRTNLVRNLPWYVRAYQAFRYVAAGAQTIEEGASHIVYLGTAPVLEGLSGKYFEGSKNGLIEAVAGPEAYNVDIAKQLWQVSEQSVGQHFAVEFTQ
jgi:NAD(P)-dependent dehydrogenase (short-subunit alcohol dehydrogenase family)